MSKAVTALKELSEDEFLRIAEIKEEMALRDEITKASAPEYYREKGFREGQEKIILSLIEAGLDEDFIAKTTKYSVEKIRSFKNRR